MLFIDTARAKKNSDHSNCVLNGLLAELSQMYRDERSMVIRFSI
ncbi:hypothetical protein PCIT_a1331 [Pseudoalteromonas citrea]|uniref:Uncharacterized protein n=1 Tax=Pseudoalteromonas citrea TaxID=43655 RepID=A0AAD4FTM6_9GAMM|nr:hypothetical protein PCIT_a1331 [Pseudoalteromonas citrea]